MLHYVSSDVPATGSLPPDDVYREPRGEFLANAATPPRSPVTQQTSREGFVTSCTQGLFSLFFFFNFILPLLLFSCFVLRNAKCVMIKKWWDLHVSICCRPAGYFRPLLTKNILCCVNSLIRLCLRFYWIISTVQSVLVRWYIISHTEWFDILSSSRLFHYIRYRLRWNPTSPYRRSPSPFAVQQSYPSEWLWLEPV